MADMRRRGPEPPAGPPRSSSSPAWPTRCCASWRRCWPRKASTSTTDIPDMETACTRALDRAVERQQPGPVHPGRPTRELAVDRPAPRRRGHHRRRHRPRRRRSSTRSSPSRRTTPSPTVAGCIGVALGLLDDWLSGRRPERAHRLAAHTRLPPGHWNGERAATDILALARKGRAFRSLDTLIIRQGGHKSSTAAPSPSPPRFVLGPTTPAHQWQSLLAPPSADRYSSQPSGSLCCDDHQNPPDHPGVTLPGAATAAGHRDVAGDVLDVADDRQAPPRFPVQRPGPPWFCRCGLLADRPSRGRPPPCRDLTGRGSAARPPPGGAPPLRSRAGLPTTGAWGCRPVRSTC